MTPRKRVPGGRSAEPTLAPWPHSSGLRGGHPRPRRPGVRLVARSYGAKVPEPVIGGGVDGGHHDRVLRADAVGHGHADHLVDVALLDDETGLPVVGAEHAPVGAVLLHEWEQ